VIAAIIETHCDEKGIIWPKEAAPFDVQLLPLAGKEGTEEINALCERYYQEFKQQKFEVLVDDREESPGRKFNDADLIGIPLRVTVGARNLKDGKVEIKLRRDQKEMLVNKDDLVAKVLELLK
jgi:prolyl-tRNA synthetase